MRRRDALPDPEVDHGLRELEAALAGEPAADPQLTRLVADVRAAAPAPDPRFLASLDARVHAGFPREEDTPRRPSRRAALRARFLRPTLLAPSAAATLVAALVVVGIATSGGGDDRTDRGSASSSAAASSSDEAAKAGRTATMAPGAARDEAAPSTGPGARPAVRTQSAGTTAAAAVPMPTVPSTTPRKVQRAAELTLTPAPADVQDTADGVVRETQAAGGYVQTSSIRTREDGGTASFTLRIPSAKLDDTLASLSKLAHVGSLSQSSTDITAQTASAADRLSDARAERRALLQALGRATTDRQIASLKARLRDNRSEIARRQGALDAQRRRADLATVAVEIDSAGQAAAPKKGDGAWTPRDALHDAGRVLEVAGGVALIALAVLAPLAVLVGLAALAGRAVRRRRRESALDGAR
ncbi:MAG TPA: DUF4349 domain-containing protein [Baekduia sp.]|uniref:DUF4349 domain-containing protein n=1 Tax=Baekduia sp. TaxID=2600305 RepID=UPI002D76B58A|nr:DUF4349 domain-containing protein [Baekduia sp.]HET6505489.1 DUF4349 domain-containing protein [Baekduia sp.]